MKSTPVLALAACVLLAACETEPARESAAPAADTVAAAPTISLADAAGTWTMRYTAVSGGTEVPTAQVEITADGWTLLLPDRDPIPAQVTASGDSLIVVEGPYQSVRRPSITVTTNGAYRLDGDRLVGVVAARYDTGGADSLYVMLGEGTREP
jgi:glucose/arabinose dehydrogenase